MESFHQIQQMFCVKIPARGNPSIIKLSLFGMTGALLWGNIFNYLILQRLSCVKNNVLDLSTTCSVSHSQNQKDRDRETCV